jgi:hypothetical protein
VTDQSPARPGDQNPPQQPSWQPQPYPAQPQQPGSDYEWAAPAPPSGYQQPPPGYAYQPPPNYGYQQPPPGYGYQQPPQQGYPSGPGRQGPRSTKGHRVRNVLLGVAGGIVLIVVIAAVASSSQDGVNKSSTPPAANAATTAPSSPKPSDNSTTGPIGTTFVVTDTTENGATVKYSVTLDKVIQHAQPDNSFDTAPAGDHLTAAEFTIKGLVGDDQDDANNNASAVGNDNQTYQPGFESLAAGTNFNGGAFNTSPGSVSIGWVAFEVKDGVRISSIQWNPDSGMSGNAPGTWTVGG